jgi:hypothetical protein
MATLHFYHCDRQYYFKFTRLKLLYVNATQRQIGLNGIVLFLHHVTSQQKQQHLPCNTVTSTAVTNDVCIARYISYKFPLRMLRFVHG